MATRHQRCSFALAEPVKKIDMVGARADTFDTLELVILSHLKLPKLLAPTLILIKNQLIRHRTSSCGVPPTGARSDQVVLLPFSIAELVERPAVTPNEFEEGKVEIKPSLRNPVKCGLTPILFI